MNEAAVQIAQLYYSIGIFKSIKASYVELIETV